MKLSLLLIFILSFSAFSETGHSLMDQEDFKDSYQPEGNEEASTLYLPEESNENRLDSVESSEENWMLPSGTKEAKFPKDFKVAGSDYKQLGTYENSEKYLEMDNLQVVRDIHNTGNKAFSFSYIKDSFDYKDPSGIFQNTYEATNDDTTRAGMLLFSVSKYFSRGTLSFSYGTNLGFGYNTGLGRFSDGSTSTANFKLWTIPLDFTLGMEIPLGRWVKLGVAGGPSIMGLWQSRSDLDEGDRDKTKRQMSPGYFASAKLQISLNRIFKKTGFKLYKNFNVSDTYLDIGMRMNGYSSFLDDLEISGSSISMGFSFEHL